MFEDLVEIAVAATDPETYRGLPSLAERARQITYDQARQKVLETSSPGAKKFGPLPLVVQGIDAGIDRLGIDDGRAVRNAIGLTPEDVANPGFGMRSLPAEVAPEATDNGAGPPPEDRTIGGWFDP